VRERPARANPARDRPIGEQGDVLFADFVASEGPPPEEEVEVTLRSQALTGALSLLPSPDVTRSRASSRWSATLGRRDKAPDLGHLPRTH